MAPSPLGLPIHPGTITLSDEERAAGRWSPANIMLAQELMHRDGLLVLDGIIDKEVLGRMKENMMATAAKLKAKKAGTKIAARAYNLMTPTNFLQTPPLSDPSLLHESVFSNNFLLDILENYLGPNLKQAYTTANVAIGGSKERQPVHRDGAVLLPNCPSIVVCNFLLADFSPETGSTEFWLGSHNNTDARDLMWASPDAPLPMNHVDPAKLEERRPTRPPAQVVAPFGAFTLRDFRTWHAGRENPSKDDRIMGSIAYQAAWFPNRTLTKYPESSRAFWEAHPRVEVLAQYFPDEEWNKFCHNWYADDIVDGSPSMAFNVDPRAHAEGSWYKPLGVPADDEKVLFEQSPK